jgi:hypothetical protein
MECNRHSLVVNGVGTNRLILLGLGIHPVYTHISKKISEGLHYVGWQTFACHVHVGSGVLPQDKSIIHFVDFEFLSNTTTTHRYNLVCARGNKETDMAVLDWDDEARFFSLISDSVLRKGTCEEEEMQLAL